MTRLRVVRRFLAAQWRGTLAASGGLALLGGLVVIDGPSAPWPTATARVQPFDISLLEVGTMGVERLALYGSTIPGAAAKLVELAPEGTVVTPGDVIARFDTSPFEQARQREVAMLRQAEAELARAREEARLEIVRASTDLQHAQQQIASAERALTNQRDGRGRVEIAAAETAAADASRQQAEARQQVDDLSPLLREGFITRAEFERAEQALRRAEDQARLAVARRDALVQFETPAALSRAEADVQVARDGLLRQGDAANARAGSRVAAIDAAASRIAEIRARIDVLDDQISRGTIRAEAPGLLVHRHLYFGSEQRKPQVGDEVFPNQPILAVPDSSKFTVETQIRETDLHRIAAGQHASVRVDAYPDLRLPATITLIGALATEDPARAGIKFFPVTLTIDQNDARLRPGMTAHVEIAVMSLAAAIVVPVQAVFDAAGTPYVVVLSDAQPVRRPVTLLGSGDTLAAVAAGIDAGAEVLLIDPTTPGPAE